MRSFQDVNGAVVTLAFEQPEVFGREPDHILVICRYRGNWLLTNHKIRGWEFPGGKREIGETIEQAAAREVFEETGGELKSLQFVGEYKVKNGSESFIKRIYFSEIEKLIESENFFETSGPVLEVGDLLSERFKDHYSFIMKDEIVRLSLEKLSAAGQL